MCNSKLYCTLIYPTDPLLYVGLEDGLLHVYTPQEVHIGARADRMFALNAVDPSSSSGTP